MRIYLPFLALMVLLSGCASWSTYNKQRDFLGTDSSTVFIDAKQRAVISNVATDDTGKSLRRFCAEPSPDALSVFAASAGLNLSVPTKGDLGYSQAFSEGAASIGLRTQSIQLLRDVMFSNCEAFINNGVTGFGLETMQRRFQSTLVAVLAIEQLTGVTKAQQPTLGAQSSANNAEVLGAAIKLVADADASVKASKTKLDGADSTSKTAAAAFDAFKLAHATDTTSDDYKAAKEKADKAKAALAEADATHKANLSDLADARTVRSAAVTAGGSTAVDASLPAGVPHAGIPAESASAISEAVVAIVEKTLSLGFGREVCTTLFGKFISQSGDRFDNKKNVADLSTICLDYLKADAKAISNVAADRASDAESRNIGLKVLSDAMQNRTDNKITASEFDKVLAVLENRIPTKPATNINPVPFSKKLDLIVPPKPLKKESPR